MVAGPIIEADFIAEAQGKRLASGSYRRNRARIERLLKKDPSVDYYLVLSILEARKGYWHRAQAAVEEALKLEPQHADAMLLLAQICEAQDDLVKAASLYQTCVRVHTRFAKAYREYARYLMSHTDNITLAQNLLFHCLELDPKDSIAHTLMAEIYLLRGKTGQALLHLELAAHYYRANPLYHQRKAKVFMEMKKYEEAARQLKLALRMDPKNKAIRSQFTEVLKATNTPRIFLFWKRWVI
jgi:tetratricopeptide (TPR) repeat protein